jgi:hypothetical protein
MSLASVSLPGSPLFAGFFRRPDAFPRVRSTGGSRGSGSGIVFKGSISVDGISLTVAELQPDRFVVWIIPHTWQVTNLHQRTSGQRVNLEFDLIAKYVERMLTPAPGGEPLSPVPNRAP